jgi:hypothetical protein
MRSRGAIVERGMDLLKPSGERIRFRVEFGPVREEGPDFRCRVQFHGWGDSPPDIWGYDSLQALVLSVALVRSILADFVRRRGRGVWPETDNDYSLDFPLSLERADAEPSAPPNRGPTRRRAIRASWKGGGR